MPLRLQQDELVKSPLFLLAPFFFLGTAMVVMKLIIPHTTPLFLAAFRLLPAGAIVLLLAAVLKLPQPKTAQAWLWIALFALIDGALFQGFLTTGLVNTGAGLGAVLIDAQPLVVALLSRLLFSEFIGLWGWLGLLVGIVGICLCGLPSEWLGGMVNSPMAIFAEGTGDPLSITNMLGSGEFLMLMAALSMSFGTIIVRYVKQHADPIVATGWHMLLGGLPLIALSAWGETDQISALQGLDWLGLAYATLFGTAVTYGIFFFLAAVGNMTSVSALIFLTPVFALLFSSLFLAERLTQFQWLGVVFTLISVYLVNQREQIAAWTAGFGSAAEAVEDALEAAVEDAIAPTIASPAITAPAVAEQAAHPPTAID
ncbi:DMT family transporter [Nodosilinea nodulosa]|uniref:DMT family transporter n=1 Tax=Nodosilinea nodulosa TaxID=416001 RepID=UPI0002DC041E|nr:DMT family transporter [Nodosilinea nodulosa]